MKLSKFITICMILIIGLAVWATIAGRVLALGIVIGLTVLAYFGE